MPAPLVVIDTNVWLDYFDPTAPTAEADRQLLRRAKRKGLVRPILTAPISAELMRTCAREGFDRYAAMMRFAWNMCGARVLATDDDREEAELRHRRTLERREGEALMSVDRRREFRDGHMLDEEHARKIAQVVAQSHVERRQRLHNLRGAPHDPNRLTAPLLDHTRTDLDLPSSGVHDSPHWLHALC